MVVVQMRPDEAAVAVRLVGQVTGSDWLYQTTPLERDLQRRQPGFTFIMDCSDLVALEMEAVGIVYYLAQQLLRARPGAIVLINPDALRPNLRRFLLRCFEQRHKVHLFETVASASDFLNTRPRPAAA